MTCCNTATHKLLQRVLPYQCNYTAHAIKQRTGLYRGISCNLTYFTAYNSRQIQTGIMPPVPRWSVCQRPDALHRVPDTTATPDAAQVSTAAYYNKVYKRVQHIADHTSPAAFRRFLASIPAQTGTGFDQARSWHGAFFLARRRGTIDGYRRIFFRAFAR